MKNLANKFITKAYTYGNTVISGALLIGLFQVPFLPPQSTAALKPEQRAIEAVFEDTQPIAMVDEFLGSETPDNVANSIIEKKADFVSTRPAYSASLAVIQKHENTIRKEASEKGVPQDVALGVSLLENGGSETAVSPAGALGVFQLMPGTARSLGLTVTKKVDERKDPETNIEAGIRYLRSNFERFGDWGLATWAYHAGEGNVSKAVQLYAKANHGVTLKGVKDPQSMKEYVEKHGITVHKLLSSQAVKNFTKKLNDDSAGYPYKVLATAKLFKEAKSDKPEKKAQKEKATVESGSVLVRKKN